MAKFLKATTVNAGKHVVPADGFIMCKKSSNTVTEAHYEAESDVDKIVITHGSLSGHEFPEFLQNQLINLAQTNWRNAVVDVTSSAPATIQNIEISSL
jgi:hypothetical protein